MRHIDELDILDHLGRGTKAKESSYSYSLKSQRYWHYNKNISHTSSSSQKAVDRLESLKKRHKLFVKYQALIKVRKLISS